MGIYQGLTSKQEFDTFVSTPKSIRIPQSGFKKKPSNNSFSEMRFPFIDSDGKTIQGWSMLVQVKDISHDFCKETYIVFRHTDGLDEAVFRLDVAPKQIKSHNGKSGVNSHFYGSHYHELDQDININNDEDMECFERENRKNWLNFVAEKLKITIIEPEIGDLFGGWEWTA